MKGRTPKEKAYQDIEIEDLTQEKEEIKEGLEDIKDELMDLAEDMNIAKKYKQRSGE